MKTFEFTDEQRHELIEIFVHGTIQELLSRIELIVSERITPEPGESGQKRESPFIGEITISDLRKLFAHRASRITEDPNQGANQLMTLTDFRLALADMRWRIYNDGLSEQSESVKPIPSIPIVGGGSVASDRTEQCESAKEFLSKTTASGVIERKGVGEYSMSFDIDKLASILTIYASQVCADKEQEIEELKIYEKAYAKMDEFSRAQCAKVERLESELSAANESLAVMVRKNAELEKEVSGFKSSMLSAGMISGKDAEKFKKRHNISIETIDLRKIENGYDINNPKTK